MSNELMHVGRGLNVDDAISILHGAGAPGGDAADQDSALVGSLYSNTSNGDWYRKHTAGAGTGNWQEMAGGVDPTSLNGVTTPQVLDYVLVDEAPVMKWIITATEVAVPANQWSAEIVAFNNGTAAADATEADWNEYGELKLGAKIDGLEFSIALSGVTTSQQMQLIVDSTDAVDVVARRVSIGQITESITLDTSTVPHDLATTVFGVLANSEIVMFYAPSRGFVLPANFVNSRAISLEPATAEAVFSVYKVANGTWVETLIGTFTFAAASQEAVFNTSAQTTIAAGDAIKIVGPATFDVTLADMGIALQAAYL
ncbi:MAG: hypothetical protein KAJ73_00370 [Zetaproteobacteria bacterium]|nr:hypothetical protein [Zetaproteobacteria bacterium]